MKLSTRTSCPGLGVNEGSPVTVLIKSTEVALAVD